MYYVYLCDVCFFLPVNVSECIFLAVSAALSVHVCLIVELCNGASIILCSVE